MFECCCWHAWKHIAGLEGSAEWEEDAAGRSKGEVPLQLQDIIPCVN